MSARVVRASFENTFADVLAADRAFRRSRAARRIDRSLGLLMVAVGVWSLFGSSSWLGAPLAVVGLLVLFDLFPRPIIIWLAYRRTPALQGTWELDADAGGIRLRTAAGEVRTPWSGFTRTVESPRSFVLVAGDGMVGYVPKRALEPGDDDTFRELAQAGIADA